METVNIHNKWMKWYWKSPNAESDECNEWQAHSNSHLVLAHQPLVHASFQRPCGHLVLLTVKIISIFSKYRMWHYCYTIISYVWGCFCMHYSKGRLSEDTYIWWKQKLLRHHGSHSPQETTQVQINTVSYINHRLQSLPLSRDWNQ